MAFGHGKNGRVLFGKYNLSPYLTEFSSALAIDTAEVTTLGKNSKEFVVGTGGGALSLSGVYDGAAAAIDEMLADMIGDDTPYAFLLGKAGISTIGARVHLGAGYLASYEVSGGVGGAVQTAAEVEASGGIDLGVLLADHAQRNATGQATSVDNAASSANGGVAVVHMTQYASATNVIVKVQHSTDNSVWSDLITFATLTGTGSERKEVSGTVNRYVRAQWTLSGAGTFTFAVGFARR